MTHSPPNNDDEQTIRETDPKVSNNRGDAHSAGMETPRDIHNETPLVREPGSVNALPDDLSPDEVARAKEALAFLNEVRDESLVSDQPPASIGRYSIVRSLGRGGFAEVFLAEDEELDRKVALKVPLFNSTTNEAGRQRFEREAKLAASLGHPQIVPVYEYGDLGPVRFIAFAWCDGPNLNQWIAEHGPVDFETAAKMIQRLADAVQHAHQRGIVHRDLKPGNVLVDNSAESESKPVWDRLRITDFGLARNFDSHDATLTQDGQLVGTPAYMAPEQAGSGAEVGQKADIWALGMMLLELATGQLPFRKPEIFATIKSICDDNVPRARKLRPDVPVGLDAIVDLCLRKNPDDRYESAYELAEDLRRWGDGEPVKAKPLSKVAMVALWTRRNPVVASMIGLTIASLVIGMSIALWQRNVALNNLREAVAQKERADDNLSKAQALINDIIYLEKSLGTQMPLTKGRAEMLRRASQMQVALIKDEEHTPQVRYSTAMTFRNLSELLSRLGDYEASVENASYVLQQLDGLENDLPENVSAEDIYKSRVLQRLFMLDSLNSLGRYDEAIELFEANEAEPVPEEMDPFDVGVILTENLRGKSVVATSQGDTEKAAEALQLAIDRLSLLNPESDKRRRWDWTLTHCRLSFALADVNLEQQAWGDAEMLLDDSNERVNSLEKLFPRHPFVQRTRGDMLFRMGRLKQGQSQYDAAVENYEACRKLRLGLLDQSPEFPTLAQKYLQACVGLATSHKENGAEQDCQRVAKKACERMASFSSKWSTDPKFAADQEKLKELAGKDSPDA